MTALARFEKTWTEALHRYAAWQAAKAATGSNNTTKRRSLSGQGKGGGGGGGSSDSGSGKSAGGSAASSGAGGSGKSAGGSSGAGGSGKSAGGSAAGSGATQQPTSSPTVVNPNDPLGPDYHRVAVFQCPNSYACPNQIIGNVSSIIRADLDPDLDLEDVRIAHDLDAHIINFH